MAIVGGEAFGWDRAVWGNHRAVVEVDHHAPAVWVRLPWRRRDPSPEQVALVVTTADGAEVANARALSISRDAGEVAFEPTAGPGRYHIYYLPYDSAGTYYPSTTYRPAAEPTWQPPEHLIEARFVAFEAVAEHHAFGAMEACASAAEVAAMLEARPGQGFLVFGEDRDQPIRMTRDVPLAWTARAPGRPLELVAAPGEFRVFQVGLYAARRDLGAVAVCLDGLPWDAPDDAFRCFNLAGTNHDGRPLTHQVSVPQGGVQALWCGFGVPAESPAGRFQASLAVEADDELALLPVIIEIAGEAVARRGDDEPERLSRLRWLDSNLARDDTLVPPFVPVTVTGATLGVLGRTMRLAPDGLPASLASYFAPEVTHLTEQPAELLAAPVELACVRGGQPIVWRGEPYGIDSANDGAVAWSRASTADGLRLALRGRLEFDGTLAYEVELAAEADVDLDDVALVLPLARELATHMVGLGQKGGQRPESFDWRWSVERNQDSVWLGCPWAGVQVSLRDERYRRPLNTNFYHSRPLVLPRSWHNDGAGGITIGEHGGAVRLVCAGGARHMAAGESLRFDFRLALTPFKPLDTASHFRTRLCHRYLPVGEVAEAGANAIVLHHAQAPNPYINYPFLRTDQLRAYVDEAHAADVRLKLYYTVRELTTRAPELWALRSLGDEVFAPGPGGGYSWLCEHLGEDYLAAWFDPTWEDSSLVTNGMSRWHNFYVEGLAHLAEQVGIDGLYIDDLAFDREIMKRVRRVLARHRPAPHIDLHSANQYNERDGFASSMNLYLEHLPYLDRLWLGEYFDYNSPPDYWLTDISGIPFGVMGEMLQDGGNPWRGMLYGMTCRYPYNGDPTPLWRFWDEVGLADMAMVGYWSPNCPVRTGRDDVLATVYQGRDKAVIALASWATEPVEVGLAITDRPADVAFQAPAIEGFQPASAWVARESVRLEPGRGWLLIVDDPLQGGPGTRLAAGPRLGT
ncbi:MAG: hypothetical protein HZB16_08545 [Armatimonadetes bacterium]|nr:hypothetical protein [Armatimonadota bacterium]